MKFSLPSALAASSPGGGVVGRLRGYWGGRRGLIVLGGGALALGIGLNWGWLAAVGVTPILLALLPCAAMCALGLCMPGMHKKTSATPPVAGDVGLQATPVAPAPRLQFTSSGGLPEQNSAVRQTAAESVSLKQGCCQTSGVKGDSR